MNTETKNCQNCKSSFVIEPEDFDFYKKISVPPPTLCPPCRDQRRLAFRNERSLYKRACDLCGAVVVSRASTDKPYPVYCRKCWWSDGWDGTTFGRDYDFSRPFFEQFRELLYSTPHIALLNLNTVNSDWVNQETDDRNCYLNVGGHFNEDSAYNTYELYGKNCFDNYWALHSEFLYECVNCEKCYKTSFSQECFECRDTILSYDCRNCSNIIGCAGLRNKQYCIFNRQVSKEEYQKFVLENPTTSHAVLEKLKTQAAKTWLAVPRRFAFVLRSQNCTGHFITNSKNAINCWNADEVEDVKHLYITGIGMKDSYDGSAIGAAQLCYEGASSGGLYGSKFFTYMVGGGTNTMGVNASYDEYCYAASGCHHCFGCANLRGKQYCILNKQYTKEEYEALVPRIIEHMNTTPYVDAKGRTYKYGEFFPVETSPFAYNETVAQEHYPLSKEDAKENGYAWREKEDDQHHRFSQYTIADDSGNVENDVLEKVLRCEVSGEAYRIISPELSFYRTMGLPLPRRSPAQRHRDRIDRLLPRRLFERGCQCFGEKSDKEIYINQSSHFHGGVSCPNTFHTPYAPDRPEIVYCESCYSSEVA